MSEQTGFGTGSLESTQIQDDQSHLDPIKPRYVSLGSCDNTFYWLQGFRRKFVDDKLNAPPLTGEPFNDPFSHGTHYCLWVHGRAKADHTITCKIHGSPIVQRPAEGKASIFNSIYWPRCDGTYRNSLEDKLVTVDGRDRLHTLLKLRLRDVVVPEIKQQLNVRHNPTSPTADIVRQREVDGVRGIEVYEKFKDAFVIRFL